jgi:hypothetical protein
MWLGYFILLSAVQTAVMLAWVKAAGREEVSGGR